MPISIFIKRLISTVFLSSGYSCRVIKRFGPEKGLILMYHRILPIKKVDESIQPGMYVTPETLTKHIRFLKENFEIVSLKEAYDILIREQAKAYEKPICVITFDDGWRDFLQYAYPILQKFDTPATVFLPTNYIDSTKVFWTDQLAYLLSKRNDRHITIKSESDDLQNLFDQLNKNRGNRRNQIESSISLMKKLHPNKIDYIMNQLKDKLDVEPMNISRLFLDWSEVKLMSDSKLVSYGSHTASHPILTNISPSEVNKELADSKERLLTENVVDSDFIPFCYPNGNFNEAIANLVRRNGYHLSVTTKRGWSSQADDIFMLNRVGIHEDISSTTGLFASRIAGIL